jgi:hypothetical protein
MEDELDNPKTVTIRCRIRGCGFIAEYEHNSPTAILRLMREYGWRVAQLGRKSLAICPKHYPKSL